MTAIAIDHTASSTTCGFDFALQHDFVRQPVTLSFPLARKLFSLPRDDFSAALYFCGTRQLAEIFVTSREPESDTSREIAKLARPQKSLDDEYSPPPARPETVSEALWIFMQLRHLPKPSIQLLDEGEIVFSWVRDNLIADFQFDGSGAFCAYIGNRPNKVLLREKFEVASPTVKTGLIACLEKVLNESREKA
jgi:hypothetical protein